MSLAPEVIAKLVKPLDPNRVKKREGGGGRSLSYLESHDVIRTANEVFGIGGWSYHVNELTHLGTEKFIGRDAREGTRTGYRATVSVFVGETQYCDVGYGDATEYTQSTVTTHELASKEAVSDAVKRALRNFGDQFGLCLYSKDAPEHNGRNANAPGTGANTSSPSAVRETGAAGDGVSATVSEPAAPQFVAPVASSMAPGEWVFPSGKHQGKSLAETPLDYVSWYAEKGPKPDVRELCGSFLAQAGGGFVDDIPFA